jgi:hypothetical protein
MLQSQPVYKQIAQSFQAWQNCRPPHDNNTLWEERHHTKILSLVNQYLPSGSGFDNGTKFDFDLSKSERLVFQTAFHFMNENGYYDGWEDYIIHVTPSLTSQIELRIIGKNRNDIKDYIHEVFYFALTEPQPQPQPQT